MKLRVRVGKKELSRNVKRQDLLQVEEELKKHPNVFLGDSEVCPLKHSFCNGMYVREIFIPSGTVLTGKIHKHDHPNFLMSGTVKIATEEGVSILKGPLSMISKAGTKRVLHALTDAVWVTVHENPTNTQDLKELEAIIIANDYDELDGFLEAKSCINS